MVEDSEEIGATEGIFATPEGGALLVALKKLLETGEVKNDNKLFYLKQVRGLNIWKLLKVSKKKSNDGKYLFDD